MANAMIAVLQVLKEAPSMSIAGISKATGVDRRTVSKAVDLIMNVQKSLSTQRMEREKRGKMWVISLKKKTSEIFDSAKSKMKR
ncbi:MAG: hypothetical protein ACFFE2_10835 [Candidatus Thorarchaeota archaeon]